MQSVLQDFRLALRSLRRSPAFTFTVIATLGIGIGLNAAIFTVVDCVLLRPLGYRDADRIVALGSHFIDQNRSIPRLGGDDYADLAQQVKSLETTAFYQNYEDGLRLNGESLYLPIANVSPAFGQVMGVQPIAGRIFLESDAMGRDALVSANFARDHFGSAPTALGKTVLYGGELRTIVGVLPNGFSFPGKTAVWFERNARPEAPSRTAYNQQAIGKLRPGISLPQLNAELAGFSRQLQNAYPEDRLKTIEATGLQERVVGTVRPTLHLLMGAVAVILLIVAANVTHLQLVRATRDLRAVTIRTALGASRSALAGHALLEALLLAAAGFLFAILLAVPALRLLVRIAPPDIPRLAEIRLNLDVLLFSFLVSALLMGLTAILPVWRSWHLDPASALRQDAARGTENRATGRLRNSFLIAEVASLVNPVFFSSMQIPLAVGRFFTESDDETHPPVAIVNEALARRYYGSSANAVGKRIMEGASNKPVYDTEIVGVVPDFKSQGVRDAVEPSLFLPLRQATGKNAPQKVSFYLRTGQPPAETIQTVRRAMQQVDPLLALDNLWTMDQQIERSLANDRLTALLAISFGVLATLLAGIGLYGVLAYSTAQRTREIGIRIALGSSRLAVSRLVLSDVLRLAGIGILVALPVTFAFGRLLRSQLFGVTPNDPLTLFAAISLIAVVALSAALLPATRAASVNPTEALRTE